jgi:TfdA family taurine catabolism dioxygenase TauD
MTDAVLAGLRHNGYYVTSTSIGDQGAVRFVLDIGRSLGKLYVPKGCDPAEPVIWTAPTRARGAAPFDRPEGIGWHNDFATYEDRPELSLFYITRADPRGGDFGAWRLASVARVIRALCASHKGRASFNLLSQELLPFSYADGEAPREFKVIETRSNGTLGIRFYPRSIRRGCIAEYGAVPPRITAALGAVERAADDVGEVVPTQEGSLLIASNWYALHDRVRQTISCSRPNREALLCFVAQQPPPAGPDFKEKSRDQLCLCHPATRRAYAWRRGGSSSKVAS